MARTVSTSITRRGVVAGPALTAAPITALAGAGNAAPHTIIGDGRRQLLTRMRLTANQEAPRARCYSRCSTASRAFDPPLSRR